MFRLAVDIGGTFTDLYIWDSEQSHSYKSPTTPGNLTYGVWNVLEKAATDFDITVQQLLEDTGRFIHGTTVATNAIIEENTSKTALITTEGFKDILTQREKGKQNVFDWEIDYPGPYIPQTLTFGVDERINAEGEIETAIDENEVQSILEEIEKCECDAVAVSLLWGHKNPVHEQKIGEIIEEFDTNIHYSLSHEVNPIIREYRRTSSTAINASLQDIVSNYVSKLEQKLEEYSFSGEIFMITANGGVMQLSEIAENPIWITDAGPTMIPTGTGKIVENELNQNNIVAVDLGGTSLDISIVSDGRVTRTREAKVGANYMLGIDKVDIKSIGSGGGSIARVDKGGLLHIGPQSAGAKPGPACYGRGGEQPTVTDAAVQLGYINPEYFLGGDLTIDTEKAKEVMAKIGTEFKIGPTEAAHMIYKTMNQDIVNGIKERTIERGLDPQKFVLSGGGGALGSHIVPIARELNISEILLPENAGVGSAMGGLVSNIRRDFSASFVTTGENFDEDGVNKILDNLQTKAENFCGRASISDEDASLSFYSEARYADQVWSIRVEIPVTDLPFRNKNQLIEKFHETHESVYGFSTREQDVEFHNWAVEVVGDKSSSNLFRSVSNSSQPTESPVPDGHREGYFSDEYILCEAYRAEKLSPNQSIEGPAFIDAETTTIVLPPNSELTITENYNYHIFP